MSYRSIFLLTALIFLELITAILLGCSRDPNVRKHKYLESGERYLQKGQYREAAIQFSNALQVDPGYGEAYYQRAIVHLRSQQWALAYQDLSRVLELQPANYAAHLEMADLLIAGHDLKQAQEQTNLLLREQPANPQVHLAVASLLAAQGKLSDAIEETKEAISLAPQKGESYLRLGLLQMKMNQLEQAEINFKRAVNLAPTATNAWLALGAYYESLDRYTEAEQQFQRAIESDPNNPDPCAALVRVYVAEGKMDQAETFLKKVAPMFADNPMGYRMLGDFYVEIGSIQKADSEYASLRRAHPGDVHVKKNYVQLLFRQERLSDARNLNNELLRTNPADTDALIFEGQIQLRGGQAKEAVESLQAVIKQDPANANAHYQLGLALDALGYPERAESQWREAVRLKPDMIETLRSLAGIAIRRADWIDLEHLGSAIVELHPSLPEGYAIRAIAASKLGHSVRSEKDINKTIELAPDSSVGYIELGSLRLLSKRYDEAASLYQKALQLDPTSTDALAGLMQNFLAQKQTAKAITVARAQISKVPNSSGFYDLLGTALFNDAQDYAGAEAALHRAVDLDGNNSDALLKLGQVQIAEGRTDQAIMTYEESLKNNPREPSLYIVLGEMYEAKQDWANARSSYEKVLRFQPDNAAASAWR